ncbi:DMT family transporter [Desulfohalobium retbaense]|uniref:EamA domain-containing protein n=1 Tax=Desulfohalobium retbaense (strain ATCC 49708 / DSM 5692 / JCM 16813 / HR100) TaxID=485915 RepID=C8X2B3_DESRD|nr:DMT family transporter [Desulfohalobium retbaense]ACV68560.1 protein of unknown function DUF6 transmembrane [Desulfohalobium retbaense DSM 5692]
MLKNKPMYPEVSQDGLLLFVVVSWGMTFLFTKLGLPSFPVLNFAAMRTFAAAGTLTVCAGILLRHRPHSRLTRGDHVLALLLGGLGMGCFPYVFSLAMSQTSAANAGLIFGATPVAVGGMSALLGLERLRAKDWLGLSCSFAGIALVSVSSLSTVGIADLQGDMLMFLAMLMWAGYTVGNRFVSESASRVHFTALASLWGSTLLCLMLGPALFRFSWSTVTPSAWTGVFGAGVLGTGIAYVLWSSSVKKVGPARTAVYMNLVPLVAAVCGAVVLHEPLRLVHLPAAVAVMTGVVLTRGQSRKRSAEWSSRAEHV